MLIKIRFEISTSDIACGTAVCHWFILKMYLKTYFTSLLL